LSFCGQRDSASLFGVAYPGKKAAANFSAAAFVTWNF